MSTTKARLNFKESIKSTFASNNTGDQQAKEIKMLPSSSSSSSSALSTDYSTKLTEDRYNLAMQIQKAAEIQRQKCQQQNDILYANPHHPHAHFNEAYSAIAAFNCQALQNFQRYQQQQHVLSPIKKSKPASGTKQVVLQSTAPFTAPYYTHNWPTNSSLCSSSLSASPSPTLSTSSANHNNNNYNCQQQAQPSIIGNNNTATSQHHFHQYNNLLSFNSHPPSNSILRSCMNSNQYHNSKAVEMTSFAESCHSQNDNTSKLQQPLRSYMATVEDDLDGDENMDDDDDLDNDDLDDDDNTNDDDSDHHNNNKEKTHAKKLKFRKQNRKRHHDGGHLYCCVCGANANGYNFNAITCESCKAFFRRNAFRDLSLFRCGNNDKCDININTRKKCKKCRITKCFDRGMNKEWIMNDAERANKRLKIQQNRMLKAMKMQHQLKQHLSGDDIVDTCCKSELADLENSSILKKEILQLNGDKLDDSMLLPNDYSQNEEQTSTVTTVRRRRRRRKRLIDTLKIIENKLSSQQDLIKSNKNTNAGTDSVVIDDDEDGKTGQNNMTNCSAFDDTATVSTNTDSDDESMYTTRCATNDVFNDVFNRLSNRKELLTIDDNTLLESITESYSTAMNTISVKAQSPTSHTNEINSTINMTRISVLRLINFFRLNADFKNCTMETQIQMLKANMIDILQVQAPLAYNTEKNTFRDPYNQKSNHEYAATSLEATYGTEKYNKVLRIIKNLSSLCNNDHTIPKILLLCVLFQTDKYRGPNLDAIKTELNMLQFKYASILYRYMCSIFSDVDSRYKQIMILLDEIRILSEQFRHIIVTQSNSKYVDGVVGEVFNIK